MQAVVDARRRRERGLSLITIVVGLSLTGVLLLGAFALLRAAFSGAASAQRMMRAQENATLAAEWMVKRIRMAGYGVSVGQSAIDVVQPAVFQFKANIDGTGGAETIRYRLSGDVLEEGVDTGAGMVFRPLSDPQVRIVGLRFTYFPNSNPNAVRRIRVTIEVDGDRDGTVDFRLTTDVKPRNVGLQ